MKFHRTCLYIVICGSTLGIAADPPTTPGEKVAPAQPFYMGRRIAQTMHWSGADWLTRHEREREEGVSLLHAELQKKVKPGMAVCDLGCGNGFWTLRLSGMVGDEGKVFAVDIQKEMLYGSDDPAAKIEPLVERAKKAGVKNVVPIVNTLTDTKLPPGSCDLILLVDVYHEFSHPEPMLKSMRAALKPTGIIALVEFRAEDDKVPIRPEHKMSKVQILKEYQPSGFKLADQYDKLPWQHVMYFQRDDAAAAESETAK